MLLAVEVTANLDIALFGSCESGKEECALALIEAGAALDAASSSGVTALLFSANGGHEQCLLELLKAGAAVDAANNDGLTALMMAAKGHERCLRALLEAGAVVDTPNLHGWTALMYACHHGSEHCARALIEAKANNEAVELKQWTALMFCAQGGHEQCLRALLEAKANVHAANGRGATALTLCCQNGHEQCALLVIEKGASLNVVSKDNFTMLMAASNGGLLPMVDRVLPQSDVNATVVTTHATQAGYTALMYACSSGHEDVTRALIKAGANIELTNEDDSTALMLACRNGHYQIVIALIETGATVNHATANGATALTISYDAGNVKCARALIKAGADVNDRVMNLTTEDSQRMSIFQAIQYVDPSMLTLPKNEREACALFTDAYLEEDTRDGAKKTPGLVRALQVRDAFASSKKRDAVTKFLRDDDDDGKEVDADLLFAHREYEKALGTARISAWVSAFLSAHNDEKRYDAQRKRFAVTKFLSNDQDDGKEVDADLLFAHRKYEEALGNPRISNWVSAFLSAHNDEKRYDAQRNRFVRINTLLFEPNGIMRKALQNHFVTHATGQKRKLDDGEGG